jgi:D-amino-acid dehydrogenase
MDRMKKPPPDNHRHVAIIGAGIVGVSTAIWLQRAGHQVTLIDRIGPAGGTSFGNGGVLASCAIVPVTVPGLIKKAPRMLFDPNQPLFLRWPYLPRLMPWLVRYLGHATADGAAATAAALAPIIGDSLADHQALSSGTGAERWIVPSDYLYVYRDREHYQSDAFGWRLRREHGFHWDEMESEAFAAFDPVFGSENRFAARLSNHGRISDPGEYVKALAAHVVASGGRLLKADVSDIVHADGRVTGLRAGGDLIPCDAAVLTAGAWSGPLARQLGLKVPMESERGYHVELWGPNIMPRAPAMIAAGKFVATPMEGRLRLAGIVEFGGLTAPASTAPFELLKKGIRAAIPGITWEREEQWMGHRPAPADSVPIIGELDHIRGAFTGFGHHHVGLTGGPKTGQILAGLISGQKSNLNLAPYAPSRFH